MATIIKSDKRSLDRVKKYKHKYKQVKEILLTIKTKHYESSTDSDDYYNFPTIVSPESWEIHEQIVGILKVFGFNEPKNYR